MPNAVRVVDRVQDMADVTMPSDGDVTITVDESVTKDATIRSGMYYDIQVLTAGVVTTLTTGTFVVSGDVTRAVS